MTNIQSFVVEGCPLLERPLSKAESPLPQPRWFDRERPQTTTTIYFFPGAPAGAHATEAFKTALWSAELKAGLLGSVPNPPEFYLLRIKWAKHASVTLEDADDPASSIWRQAGTVKLEEGFQVLQEADWQLAPRRFYRVVGQAP